MKTELITLKTDKMSIISFNVNHFRIFFLLVMSAKDFLRDEKLYEKYKSLILTACLESRRVCFVGHVDAFPDRVQTQCSLEKLRETRWFYRQQYAIVNLKPNPN